MKHTASRLLDSCALMLRHNNSRLLLFALSLLVYVLLVITGKNIGHTAAAAFLPVLTAAVCWGWQAGLAAGLCSFPVNALILTAIGLNWQVGMLNPIGLTGHAFFILAGLLIGFTRDLLMQSRVMKQRLEEKALQSFADLERAQAAERELSLTNNFLNNLIENSIDCIIIGDSTGHITNINRAGLALTGYALEDMLGKTPMALSYLEEGQYETTSGEQLWLSREDIESSYARMGDFIRDGKISNYASCIKHKDGRLVEVEHNITMLYDQQGAPVGSVSMTRDRTMRRRMERELSRQSELLSQANRELESFAYSVSHDLRAPLRSISGFSEALEEDFASVLPGEAKTYLQRIKNASGRMGLLIDDLLKLSRVSRYDMRREQVSLSALAEDIVAQLREHAPDRQITCTIEPGMTVPGDENLLRILLANLIENAWKYTVRQANPEVSFGRADETDPRAPAQERSRPIFCVRDNGVGFDMAYADKLFTAFQRLHAEQEFPGTGIGLATVQRIAHRHNGRVWADSKPGHGARFYFTLG